MRRAWVILLLIALLPVRGWAAASMAVPWLSLDGPIDAAGAVVPCHGDAVQDDDAAAPAHPASPSHLCKTCDLCHAPLAVSSGELAAPSQTPSMAPPVAHPRDTGRLMAAALERPPRA